MIKILALIFMVLDHIGHMLNTGIVMKRNAFLIANIFIIIGRFSMPLFGFCIARGYDHYLKKGNLKKYFRNIAIMALSAEFPHWFLRYKMNSFSEYPNKIPLFHNFVFNVGFTWLVSLLLLCVLNKIKINFSPEKGLSNSLTKKNLIFSCLAIAICIASVFSKIEYNLYGVLYPVIFYYFYFKYNNQIVLFLCNCAQYFIYCLVYGEGLINYSGQIFVVFVVFLILYLQKFDSRVKLPKFIFYWFYPVHLAVLASLYLTVFVKP